MGYDDCMIKSGGGCWTAQDYNEATREYDSQLEQARIREYIEKEKARKSERVECPCGGHYSGDGKRKHIKTAKHISYQNSH